MNIPLLLKPKLLSLKNRAKGEYKLRAQGGRDLVLLLFSVGVLVTIYNGTLSAMGAIRAHADVAYLHPTTPLSMLLLMLLVMLILSNSVAAVGSFFFGRDLDLLLAAPLKPAQLFWGKFSDILISSSWMAVVFALPAILAFGVSFQAGWSYYLIATVVALPYFIIPCGISAALIITLACFIPINRTREVMLLVALVATCLLFMLVKNLTPQGNAITDLNEVLRLVSLLTFPQSKWLPSYWASVLLGESLQSSAKPAWPYLGMLYSVAGTSCAAAFLSMRLFHARAYSASRGQSRALKIQSRQAYARFRMLTAPMDAQYRALISKEIKTFSRDIAQAIQLLLLMGLCMIYLYNFKVLHAVEGLPPTTKAYWQGFLVFSNVGMGAFVITAVCSRFVFPSISMEGQSFWLLQSAPISAHDTLRAKFWCWFVPVAGISSVIFASGAVAIDAAPQMILVNAMTSWIICYGVVGLAIGMGAIFANFEWENTSQLAASFGSLIFMIASSALICVSLIPVAILIFLRTLKNFGYNIPNSHWYICIITSAFLLAYANYVATRWALKAGDEALRKRSC